MKPKLLLHLLCRRPSQGFAIAFALTLGAVMVLVGISLMVRSTKDRTNVAAQQNTVGGLGLAEVGVTRFQDLFNRNGYLALYNDCIAGRDGTTNVCKDASTAQSWANVTTMPQIGACDSGAGGTASEVENVSHDLGWMNIDKQGEYRLVQYKFTPNDTTKPNKAPGKGFLTIEGRTKQGNDLQVATSRIEVEIPIAESSPDWDAIPGLWTTDSTINNNQVQGDVLTSNCNLTQAQLDQLNDTKIVDANGNDYSIKHTAMLFPDLPYGSTSAITSPNVVTLKNWNNATFPYIPDRQSKDEYGNDITKKMFIFPRLASDGTTIMDTPRDVTLNDGSIVQVYEYIIDGHINLNNNIVKISSGKRVTFYLRGDIDKGVDMEHTCLDASNNPIPDCKPTNFQIFGYGEITPLDNTAHKICLNGNRVMEAFILAPVYTVGVAGAGGGGGYKGSVWAQSWSDDNGCGSNTSNIVVTQTATWDELSGLTPKNVPPRISSISNWNRLERP